MKAKLFGMTGLMVVASLGCRTDQLNESPAEVLLSGFVLEVDPEAGTAFFTTPTSQSVRGIHDERTVVQNGLPNAGPVDTWELVTTNVMASDEGRCPTDQNCFDVTVRSFETAIAYDVTLRIEQIIPPTGHDFMNGDQRPPGSTLEERNGLRVVGTINAGGSAATQLDFQATTTQPYKVWGTLWAGSTATQDCSSRSLPHRATVELGGSSAPTAGLVPANAGGGLRGHLSNDGRYVAFLSSFDDLVAGDTLGMQDIFVHDRTTGITTRVSVATGGAEADADSDAPAISGDGRYVAFQSQATNLSGASGTYHQVYLHDRVAGTTTLVSAAPTGIPGNQYSLAPSISVDGRYVAFASGASNLVAGDTNGVYDVFVYDRVTGSMTLASVDSAGVQGNGHSSAAAIDDSGQLVAIYSSATNLVGVDDNGVADIFVRDLAAGTTTRVSVDSAGGQANGASRLFNTSVVPRETSRGHFAGNGRFIIFESEADNLVSGDTNVLRDVFVHDRQTGETTRVNVRSDGTEANGVSALTSMSISADGRFVAFNSEASNLDAADTNGRGDAFVHDRQSARTWRVSLDHLGDQIFHGPAPHSVSVSRDGSMVSWSSFHIRYNVWVAPISACP